MATRRLLFLDATSLTAYRWAGGHLSPEAEFAPDAAGLEAFAEYVAKARRSLFYLLADLAEEGFQTFSKMRPIFYQAKFNGSALLKPPYGKLTNLLLKLTLR